MSDQMGDTVGIILEYLRRYHFTNAEAAFKAELHARGGGDRSSSSVNALDWDLEWRLRSLQSADRSLESEQISASASVRNMFKSSNSQEAEVGEFSLGRSRSPSISHFYGDYTSGKFESQESLCTPNQDLVVVEKPRISPQPGIAVSFAGRYLPSEAETPFQIGNESPEPENAKNVLASAQGRSRTDPFQQADEPSRGMPSVGSLEDLGEGGQAAQATIESAELTLMWDKTEIQGQQSVSNVAAYNDLTGLQVLGRESQVDDMCERSQMLENKLSQRKLDTAAERWGFQPSTVLQNIERTESLSNSNQQGCSALERKVGEPGLIDVSAAKGHMDFWRNSTKESEEKGDGSLHHAAGTEESVKNGFISRSTKETFFEDPDLKPTFPFSFLKSSQVDEQQGLVISEYADQGIVERLDWVQKDDRTIQEAGVVFAGNGEAYLEDFGVANEELRTFSDLNGQEELPRLPPVRLRSMDKIIGSSKDGGSGAENSTRSFESAAFRSLGSTPEGNFGWNAFIDVPLGQDVSSSGFKRPVSRPSVSQGIVEDISEQLSGFATAVDGQSESAREYPDEYCDSDTYDDDEDPGYHRQPIEDETWFFAHEIDYPSDDERARHHTEKINHKQFGKLDEDDRSFVEEESYFSGEEFYRSQAAKEEYRSQQSELRNQLDRAQCAYDDLYSSSNVIDLLSMPSRGDNSTAYNGQLFDPEEVKRMRSEPAWKGFIGQANELEQESVVSGGDRLEGASVYGLDEERHGSVRSGGVGISSDAADVGSEVRDSLLGGSSEGDIERFGDQEFAAYSPSHGRFVSEEFFVEKEGRHVEVKSAPVRHLDEEEEDERDIFLRYYNEAWGHKMRTDERDIAEREALKNDFASRKHHTNGGHKEEQDNGAFVFGGFCFPSPSSTADIAASRADSGKSLWSNRGSAVQGEETDEYCSGVVGPDDTLAAWKRKSNESSPIVCASEENLPTVNLSNHSTISAHSTDEYVSLEAREDGLGEPGVGQILEGSQALVADDEDVAAVQDEIRRLSVDEDQYEIFDLRIVHRKNRTGFEEDKDFPVVINTVIAGRYHVTEYLGSAAFSKAIQAHDLHTGMDVCMKIIKNSKDFFDQSLDEIKLLKFINRHDPADKHHILRLYDYFYHREHLFIVCELLRANLYEFHKFNRESGGEVYFTMPRLQSITRQCLEALEFLHGLGIIHCDLKPENILVKSYSRCEIKIIDLGSSCFQTDHLCSYVQSRSYRAPEVILGLQYDQKIDIWSLGCILAELCSGNVLFQNDSLATLLVRVVGILGPIDPEVLAKGRDTHKYFTKNHMLYERNQETDQLEYLLPKKTSLSHRLPMGDQGFVEFVGYLLQSNPAKRPTATEALQHSWLSHPYEPISS